MKKRTRILRKVLLLTTSALMLVSISIGATLAYLTDTHSVVNTFTVGNVGLSIDEAKVDVYGVPVTPAQRETSNEYKLLPGQTYVKDPTITINDDSEDGWLFVRVDNQIALIEDSANSIASQMTAKGWTLVDGTTDIYAYRKTVQAKDKVVVFESFTIAGTADHTALAEHKDKQIVVTAYLVQAAGFNTAADAWAATEDQFETSASAPDPGENGTPNIPFM